MAGSIDTPGGVTFGPPAALLGKWRIEQRSYLSDEVWAKRIGAAEWPGLSTGMATTQPDATLDCLETGEPFNFPLMEQRRSIYKTDTAEQGVGYRL